MKHPEQRLHFAVADYLNLALPENAWWTTVGHGGFALDARTGARMKRAGVKAGVPDILIVSGGRALWIELKAEKGNLSPAQELTHTKLVQAGCLPIVCRSIGDVYKALMFFGVAARVKVAA